MVQVQAQISFDDLLRAVEQLNSFEREQFVFRIISTALRCGTLRVPICIPTQSVGTRKTVLDHKA